MKQKQTLFHWLMPIAKYHNSCLWMAALPLLMSIVLLIFWPQVQTAFWLLLLCLFAFFVGTYAVLKMAYDSHPNQTGLRGWINRQIENLLFVCWGLLFVAVLFFMIKLAVAVWV